MNDSLKKDTTNGVVWSAIERFSAQGVQFLIGLILARLLTPTEFGIIGMLALRPPQRCMKKGCAWRNIWQKGRQSNEKIENRCFVWRLFPGV